MSTPAEGQLMTPPVLSVTEVTSILKDIVEQTFPLVCVQGEISGFSRASSGHLYFTLKDSHSQMRAVMWRGRADHLKFEMHDGLEIVAMGPLEVYQARGTYQLVCHDIWPQGMGALELALRQLQAKLEAEGLFAAERKRPIPRFPRKIAMVTSPTGAAIRDMLQVMTRRWPEVHVVIVPVPVQGNDAAPKIALGIRQAGLIPGVDVIVTGRGGGSLEDLWPFNEEVVARAIAESPLPVVSAVGHEIDVTIADLVADRRALTPSEAAEIVVPVKEEIEHFIEMAQQRLVSGLWSRLVQSREILNQIGDRRVFRDPFRIVHETRQEVDEVSERLRVKLIHALELQREKLGSLAMTLDALSPLKILGRGYSLTKLAHSGKVLRSATEVQIGERIITQLADGELKSQVIE
jgi:exodeoxyribonuclease VII large subunit